MPKKPPTESDRKFAEELKRKYGPDSEWRKQWDEWEKKYKIVIKPRLKPDDPALHVGEGI